MSKISIDNPIDGTLKRVHTEVSDSTSSDEESMVKALNAKKSKVTSFKTWPRFLIIGSTDTDVLIAKTTILPSQESVQDGKW